MILEQFKLTDKVAIVTGASKGLGKGIAISLAEAGCHIVAVSSSGSSETCEIIKALNRNCLDVQIDLTRQDRLDELIESTMTTFGRIDILINNAGIIRRNDSVDFTEMDWDDVMNINLKTVFFLSQKVAKVMINQGKGKIINIASMLSYQGGIRVPSYTASKSGVKGLTMLLANEWAKYDIQVNAIAPGYMITDNTEAIRNDKKRSEEILARIPANRWGTPEDLAGAAVFLASDASNYVTGFTLAVDGGWLAR